MRPGGVTARAEGTPSDGPLRLGDLSGVRVSGKYGHTHFSGQQGFCLPILDLIGRSCQRTHTEHRGLPPDGGGWGESRCKAVDGSGAGARGTHVYDDDRARHTGKLEAQDDVVIGVRSDPINGQDH